MEITKNGIAQQILDNLRHDIEKLFQRFELEQRVDFINAARAIIHEYCPFKAEPVDYVRWVKNTAVIANDYNPNKVAPPEMKLLELSIVNDGYTQPIVTWSNAEKGSIEVIDGFHRNRVGKESKIVGERVHGKRPNWEYMAFINCMKNDYQASLGLPVSSLHGVPNQDGFTAFIQENAHTWSPRT